MKKLMKIHPIFKILLSFLILIAIFLIYSHYEYTQIQVRNIKIESKDIPKEFDGKRILFLADFQVDTMTRFNKKQMERIVKVVNSKEKDIILIGGDYSTWDKYTKETYKELEKMQIPQYGVYAVLGNHDYETEEDSVRYHKELGYTLLRNEKAKISIGNENIYIAGVEDLWKGSPDAEKALALYSQGKSIDPLVEKYQEILKKTDEIILIFPIWWSSMPAILKGFFDKINGKRLCI